MSPIPQVVRAEYDSEYRIRLTFADGLAATVDFAEWLEGPVFEPVRAPAFFRSFHLEGGTVCWPNGADIAPETLHRKALASRAA